MAQLQSQQQQQPPIDHTQKTKTLIRALNLVSGNLPLPPDLFNTVSSIYHGAEDASSDDRECEVPDGRGGRAGSEEKQVDAHVDKVLDNTGNSREDLLTDLEDALVKQRPSCVSGYKLKEGRERRYKSLIQHRLNELEGLPSSRGEELQTKCLLELYGLKLAELWMKVRSDVSAEYWLNVKCAYPDRQLFDWGMMRLRCPMYGVGDPFAMDADDQLRKKRDAEVIIYIKLNEVVELNLVNNLFKSLVFDRVQWHRTIYIVEPT